MMTGIDTAGSALDARSPAWSRRTADRPLASGLVGHLQHLLAKMATQARKIQVRQSRKRLRVCESVGLGEKRFVAVIQVDDQQFLLGGSSSSVSLLAQLDKPADFGNVLKSRINEVKS
jgi:flagellar biogenesis protein FliO